MSDDAPVRLCCGQRHYGPQCPDGRVQCCICFERVTVEELWIDPDDSKPVDICISCKLKEDADG